MEERLAATTNANAGELKHRVAKVLLSDLHAPGGQTNLKAFKVLLQEAFALML